MDLPDNLHKLNIFHLPLLLPQNEVNPENQKRHIFDMCNKKLEGFQNFNDSFSTRTLLIRNTLRSIIKEGLLQEFDEQVPIPTMDEALSLLSSLNSSGEINSSFSQNDYNDGDGNQTNFPDPIPVPVLLSTRDVSTRNEEEELSSGYNSYVQCSENFNQNDGENSTYYIASEALTIPVLMSTRNKEAANNRVSNQFQNPQFSKRIDERRRWTVGVGEPAHKKARNI